MCLGGLILCPMVSVGISVYTQLLAVDVWSFWCLFILACDSVFCRLFILGFGLVLPVFVCSRFVFGGFDTLLSV